MVGKGGHGAVEVPYIHVEVVHAADDGLVLGDIKALALAGLLRVNVPGQAGKCCEVCRIVVSHHAHYRKHLFIVVLGVRVCVHQSAEGLTDGVIGRALYVFGIAVLAEAGDVDDGELGVDFPEHVVTEAVAFPLAAAGAFDEDIGVLYHALEYLFALVRIGVEGDGALVSSVLLGNIAVARAGPLYVGILIVLDPYYVRAHIGHQRRAVGGGYR